MTAHIGGGGEQRHAEPDYAGVGFEPTPSGHEPGNLPLIYPAAGGVAPPGRPATPVSPY